jgi:hypothetical protein
MGTLYYGDNLDILRRYLKDETVDLVYLDPPFNSAQNYNAFFHEKDGTEAASQIRAFEDTWSWNQESQKVYEEPILQPGKVSEVMQAFHTFLGTNDMNGLPRHDGLAPGRVAPRPQTHRLPLNDKTLLLTLRGAGRIAFVISCISHSTLSLSGQNANSIS